MNVQALYCSVRTRTRSGFNKMSQVNSLVVTVSIIVHTAFCYYLLLTVFLPWTVQLSRSLLVRLPTVIVFWRFMGQQMLGGARCRYMHPTLSHMGSDAY